MTGESPYLEGAAPEGRVPFVSRSAPDPPAATGEPRLGPRDRWLGWVLLLTALLQVRTWYGLEGYQLADSVEYMERAHAFVSGQEMVDPRVIRSFGFSALLTPFFGAAELVGVKDHTPVVWAVRVFQMLIGLALVVCCARIGERLGGRVTGLLAAVVVGMNPVFLQYSVSPLADVAGSLGVALALGSVLRARRGFRAGLATGLWMGLALLLAYKTVPLSLMMIALVLLRDRRRAIPGVGGMLVGIGACVLLQILMDRIVYGVWGASMLGYFGENVVGVVAGVLGRVGLKDAAASLYRWYYEEAEAVGGRGEAVIRQIQPMGWYLVHWYQMLVAPVLAGLVLGLARAVKRASWTSTVLVGVTLGYLFLLHQKGSKEWRLALPLLATIGPLAGWGLDWVVGGARAARWRPAFVALLLVATIVLGVDVQRERNTRVHAGYWRALDHVEREAAAARAEEPAAPPARLASAYHWAVFLRTSEDLELTKLPHQIDAWQGFDQPMKNEVLGELRAQDWFLVHKPILTQEGHADLTHAVNTWFQVEAVLWERAYRDLGPILVMRRRERRAPEEPLDLERRTLFDVRTDVPREHALALSRELGFEEPVRMIKRAHDEEMWMLGFTYETLPGDQHGWLTTYWYVVQPNLADYAFRERLTTLDERHAWQTPPHALWGVRPTSQWAQESVVRMGWEVVAAEEPYAWREPFRPLGGAYRRGDYVPAHLWIDVATFYWRCVHCGEEFGEEHACDGVPRDGAVDRSKQVSGRLERARFGAEQPVRVGPMAEATRSEEGWRWSVDDFALVGRFFLPVHPDARVPDDGRPVE